MTVKPVRKFRVYDGSSEQSCTIEGNQISNDGDRVMVFNQAQDAGSRVLVAVVILSPGQSIREVQ